MAQSEGKVKCDLAKGIVALGRNILVKPDETPDEMPGGIIIPEHCKTKAPTTGTVYGIGLDLSAMDGSGNRSFSTPIRKGDKVMFSIYAGIKATFNDGKSLVILKEEDLLAIVEPSQEMIETAG